MPQGERGPQQRLRQRAGVAKPAMSGRCWAQVLVLYRAEFPRPTQIAATTAVTAI